MGPHSRSGLTRRQFNVVGTQVVGATVGVLVGVPIIGFLLNPLFRHKEFVWREVGNVRDVPAGTPIKYTVDFPPESGWPTAEVTRAVYVVRYGAALDQVRAFSNICTHMQCPVRWEDALGLFLCPCHGGLYDLTGANVGGPPPKPLPQWVHRVDPDTGILFVQNQLDESI